jgi:hypothetical protein
VKILFARILASTKNGQILFDRFLARKKGENPICKNSSKYETGQILFARIPARKKKGQILFDRFPARKKGENPIC